MKSPKNPMFLFKKIIEVNNYSSSIWFNSIMLGFILLALVGHCLQTIPQISKEFIQGLRYLEWGCIIVFIVEYFLRYLVASNKKKYVVSFYSIVDLLAISSSLVFVDSEFASIRIIRLFILLRLFHVVAFLSAIQHFKDSLKTVRGELFLFLVFAFILLYISSAGIYFFEHSAQPEKFASIIHSFWWSVVTITTVGYGDVYPITLGGKVFSGVIILIGVTFIAVPTGIISSALTRVKIKKSSSESVD